MTVVLPGECSLGAGQGSEYSPGGTGDPVATEVDQIFVSGHQSNYDDFDEFVY